MVGPLKEGRPTTIQFIPVSVIQAVYIQHAPLDIQFSYKEMALCEKDEASASNSGGRSSLKTPTPKKSLVDGIRPAVSFGIFPYHKWKKAQKEKIIKEKKE